MKNSLTLASACLLILAFSLTLDAQDNWTRFHGPNGTGLALDANLPAKVSQDSYLWKIELDGSGSSSPVIWNDKLFVTSCDKASADLTVHCFHSTTGKVIWNKKYSNTPHRVHKWNSFASSTPAVDENHVYVTYANPKETILVALDHDGQEIWKRDFGRWQSQHGFSTSPIVHDGKVIFFNSQQAERLRPGSQPGKSRITAVSATDGTDLWETPLTTTRACYAVPCVFEQEGGKAQIVSCNTGDGFFSVNPSNGSLNWSTLPFKMRTVAATLIADGLIIGSNGSGGGGNYLVAIRPDSKGNGTPTKAYEIRKANYVPSPIAVDGKLFLFTDKGVGQCVDLQTGELQWQERISTAGFSGSPVATKDHLYLMDPTGKLFVLAVSSKFKLVSKHELGEPSRATPAIANNRLYLRTDSHLICLGSADANGQ